MQHSQTLRGVYLDGSMSLSLQLYVGWVSVFPAAIPLGTSAVCIEASQQH